MLLARFKLGICRSVDCLVREALKATQGGNLENAKAALVEGCALYQSIQPQVAKADQDADKNHRSLLNNRA